jgi:hypothetical protein
MVEMLFPFEGEVYAAVRESNYERLEDLLKKKADPNAWLRHHGYDLYARPPTIAATLEWIQRRPSSWNLAPWEDSPIATPILTYAVSLAHSPASHKCVKYLLAYGADPHAQVLGNCGGATAMAVALNSFKGEADDWEDVALLLNAAYNLNHDSTHLLARFSKGLLDIAGAPAQDAHHQVSNISQLIIELRHGRLMDKSKKTHELMRSIIDRQSTTASLMLQAGADPNLPQCFGMGKGLPALASCFVSDRVWAVGWGKTTSTLITYGANPYAQFEANNLRPYPGAPAITCKTCTLMRMFVECGRVEYVIKLLNYCDPFHFRRLSQYTYGYFFEELQKDHLYNDLYVGIETQAPKSDQIRQSTWLSAVPVQSRTNRFKV